jgi:DNA adenine methylase
MEVYNDINSYLVNLFKCVKYHPNAIKEELAYVLNSREFFNDFKELYKCSALTDVQRAARYFYMIKSSYSSKVTTFGAKARDITDAEYLEKIQERLKTVVVENKSFDHLITHYDRDGALFYCDPPYYGTERYYDIGDAPFDDSQHIRLSEILRSIKGKCIVSYNDDDFVRSLYEGFNIVEVSRMNNLAARYGKNKSYKELIITNY